MPVMNATGAVLLAGGSGFIGRAVARVLERQGVCFETPERHSGIDLCDWESVQELDGMEAMVHVAGQASAPLSWEAPHSFYRENPLITLNLLELARLRNARLILGSSYVYGVPKYLPDDEAHPVNPSNPYMASTFMAEQLCAAYARDFGVPVTALRIFNAFGPGQRGDFLIPTVIEGVRRGALLLRDPHPRRDFVHVDDVAEAVVAALRLQGSGLTIGGRPVDVSYISEPRRGEIDDVVADVSKAARLLGWTPRITLEEGIRKLLAEDAG